VHRRRRQWLLTGPATAPARPRPTAVATGPARPVFALATLGGYLLSVWVGLFGFKEISTTAGIAAGVVEVAAFATLAAMAIRLLKSGQTSGSRALDDRAAAWLNVCRVSAVTLIGGVSAIAFVLLGVAVAGAGSPPAGPQASATLKTATANGATVLTNARGSATRPRARPMATTSP
jgi:hypothetical protein